MRLRVPPVLGAVTIMLVMMVVPVVHAPGAGPSGSEVHVRTLDLDRPAEAPDVATDDAIDDAGRAIDGADHEHDHAEIPADGTWFTAPDVPAGDGVLVGADWGGGDVAVAVRARQDGGWTDWFSLEVSHDQPDGEEAEQANADGSAPLWFGDSESFQVRASEPVELDFHVVDDGAPAAAPATAEASTRIRSRSAWGADESLRDGGVDYAARLKFGVIHHEGASVRWTDREIAEGCKQTPARIRAIYRYHTQALGWRDIGYNFVVDPCGQIWEGRYGGVNRNVVGAHAAGFNTGSFGVLALGTFHGSSPDPVTNKLVRGIEDIFAHKFSRAGIDARTSVQHTGGCSGCSSRYPSGTTVTLPRISSHQVTSTTSCPGDELQDHLFNGWAGSAWPKSWLRNNVWAKTDFQPTVATSRWAGDDRIATAVEVSRRSFRGSADSAVLATAGSYADGLVAGPLAASRNAPVLLTGRRRLPGAVAAELERLGVGRAYLVGGRSVIGNGVVADLRAIGVKLVYRLGGETRYETAERVADDIRTRTGRRAALVALGHHRNPSRAFPDALTAGGYGAATTSPVVLVAPDRLPTASRRALRGGSGLQPINRAVFFGGTEAIPQSVAKQVVGAVPNAVNTTRFAGSNRYETATLAMDSLVSRGVVDGSRVLMASGRDWPDALGAAGAAGQLHRPLLLVPPSRGYTGSVVESAVASWDAERASVVGGPSAVSTRVVREIRTTS